VSGGRLPCIDTATVAAVCGMVSSVTMCSLQSTWTILCECVVLCCSQRTAALGRPYSCFRRPITTGRVGKRVSRRRWVPLS
jgi:hypothetical protein